MQRVKVAKHLRQSHSWKFLRGGCDQRSPAPFVLPFAFLTTFHLVQGGFTASKCFLGSLCYLWLQVKPFLHVQSLMQRENS